MNQNLKKKNCFPNSKGNAVIDSLVIVIVVMVMGLVSIVGYKIFDEVNTDIQADSNMDNFSKNISGDLYNIYPSLLDNLFLFAVILLIIFVMVSVFFLDTHPLFFIISVVMLIFVFIGVMLLANAFDDMLSDSEFSTQANEFTYFSWVIDHIVQLVIGIGILVSIILFIKFR